MNGYLRQSTASQSRVIGPFVDDTDFKTAETGLTIANTDVKLRANGTTLSNKNSGGGTHQANGVYSLTWDATDTANVGELFFSVVVSGALQVFGSYTVLEEAVYDALFAASAAGYASQASVDTIDDFLDTEIAAIKTKTDQLTFTVANQVDATAATVGTAAISSASFAAGAISASALAADTIGASELAQDACQEIADEMLNRNLAGGGSGNTRSVRNALRSLRNRQAIVAGTLTVYQEDDASSAWTAAVTTTAGNPLSEVDPA